MEESKYIVDFTVGAASGYNLDNKIEFYAYSDKEAIRIARRIINQEKSLIKEKYKAEAHGYLYKETFIKEFSHNNV